MSDSEDSGLRAELDAACKEMGFMPLCPQNIAQMYVAMRRQRVLFEEEAHDLKASIEALREEWSKESDAFVDLKHKMDEVKEALGLEPDAEFEDVIRLCETANSATARRREDYAKLQSDAVQFRHDVAIAAGAVGAADTAEVIDKVAANHRALERALIAGAQLCGLACDVVGVTADAVRSTAKSRRPMKGEK